MIYKLIEMDDRSRIIEFIVLDRIKYIIIVGDTTVSVNHRSGIVNPYSIYEHATRA